MSDDEAKNSKEPPSTIVQPTVVSEKRKAKRSRTTARAKFTRVKNILQENIDDEDASVNTLDELLQNLDVAFEKLELANSEYLIYCESDDEEFERSDRHMEDAFRDRTRARAAITKKKKKRVDVNEKVNSGKQKVNKVSLNVEAITKQDSVIESRDRVGKIQVKRLDAPTFSGDI